MSTFPRPLDPLHKLQGEYQGFYYELYLTGVGLTSVSLEGKEIVKRMVYRERLPGVRCFPMMTEEKMQKSVDGEVSAILFVENKSLGDKASCTLQWQNHCFTDGRPPQLWVFDLCRTHLPNKKGKISPTGILFELVQQFAVASPQLHDIYLMVDTGQEPGIRDLLIKIYKGYGFHEESNPGCLMFQRLTMKKVVEPRFHLVPNNVFLPRYRNLPRRRYRSMKRGGGLGRHCTRKSRKKRKVRKRKG